MDWGISWRLSALIDVDKRLVHRDILRGAVKPDPAIFRTTLSRLGVDARDTLMVGDSEEADGAAQAVGCAFALVDPLPTGQRPDGLVEALRAHGVTV